MHIMLFFSRIFRSDSAKLKSIDKNSRFDHFPSGLKESQHEIHLLLVD